MKLNWLEFIDVIFRRSVLRYTTLDFRDTNYFRNASPASLDGPQANTLSGLFLSVYSTVMLLPFLGMYYDLHEWTVEHLGFGARTIAIVNTMADFLLGQVAMNPAGLDRHARKAGQGGRRRRLGQPRDQARLRPGPHHGAHLPVARGKPTYFAVMAAFTNLALSASQTQNI